MRTIAIAACTRFDIEAVAESILKANHKNYPVLVRVDDTPMQKLVAQKFRSLLNCEILESNETWSVENYILPLLDAAFQRQAEVIALDDDVILSPDAIDLADWFFDEYQENALALNLFNHSRGWEPPDLIAQSRHFCPWGWAVRRNKYELIKPFLEKPGPWDANFNTGLKAGGWHVVCPLLSRSLHSGRNGSHQETADWELIYGNHVRSDGTCRDYKLRMALPEGHLGVEELL